MLSHLKDSRIQLPSLQIFVTSKESTLRRVLVSPDGPSTPVLVDIDVDFLPDAVQPINDGQAAGMYG